MATARRDLAWLGGLCAALLVVFVWPHAIDGHRFGVGPDVPVYLWWTRVGASEGLSMVGSRPGAPALVAALAGALRLNVSAVTAGLASALGVAVGAASAALVRRAAGGEEKTWLLAGLLAGIFSVHLVAGYLANLVVAVASSRPRHARRTPPVVVGCGRAHGRWSGACAVPGPRDRRVRGSRRSPGEQAPATRRETSLLPSHRVASSRVRVSSPIAGPGPIAAETSRDGYLRRAGLDRRLVDAYRERFRLRAARYVQHLGPARRCRDRGRRCVCGGRAPPAVPRVVAHGIAVGVPIGYVTGWLPGSARHVRVRRADRRGHRSRMAPWPARRPRLVEVGGHRRALRVDDPRRPARMGPPGPVREPEGSRAGSRGGAAPRTPVGPAADRLHRG